MPWGEVAMAADIQLPVGRATHHWRIVDATDGLIDHGHVDVADYRQNQPWPPARVG